MRVRAATRHDGAVSNIRAANECEHTDWGDHSSVNTQIEILRRVKRKTIAVHLMVLIQ